MIIAIDGPAGSGKSSTAHEVARRLGFLHLDSGSFYRALTRAAIDAGIAADTWEALSPDDLDRLDVDAVRSGEGYRVRESGRDITHRIRDADVNAHVSTMARVPAVRAWLLDRLRAAAREGSLVADGRDMGTVVFPHAELKIFLTAHPTTRARRRLAERGLHRPSVADLEGERKRLIKRDRTDSERAVAPLKRAPDAIELDTSELDFEEQVDRIVRLARDRGTDREAG